MLDEKFEFETFFNIPRARHTIVYTIIRLYGVKTDTYNYTLACWMVYFSKSTLGTEEFVDVTITLSHSMTSYCDWSTFFFFQCINY